MKYFFEIWLCVYVLLLVIWGALLLYGVMRIFVNSIRTHRRDRAYYIALVLLLIALFMFIPSLVEFEGGSFVKYVALFWTYITRIFYLYFPFGLLVSCIIVNSLGKSGTPPSE